MQNFEFNFNVVMYELYVCFERIQEFEINVVMVKKEMEIKMIIIFGLICEWLSLKVVLFMDMVVVLNFRNQLEQSEMCIKELQQVNEVWEKELEVQFVELQELIKQMVVSVNVIVVMNEIFEEVVVQLVVSEEKIVELEKELFIWEERYRFVVQVLQDNEEQLKKIISEFEVQVVFFIVKFLEVKVEEKFEGGNERVVGEILK